MFKGTCDSILKKKFNQSIFKWPTTIRRKSKILNKIRKAIYIRKDAIIKSLVLETNNPPLRYHNIKEQHLSQQNKTNFRKKSGRETRIIEQKGWYD